MLRNTEDVEATWTIYPSAAVGRPSLALPNDRNSVVLIVTVIPEEADAVTSFNNTLDDHLPYEVDHINMNNHQGNVHMAAECAAKLARCDRLPDVAILIGTAGSLNTNKAPIGSVVVATDVGYYERAKWEPGDIRFGMAEIASINYGLDTIIGDLYTQRAARIAYSQYTAPMSTLQWRPGRLASGECIWKSASKELAVEVARQFSDAIAVETEGYGFLKACKSSGVRYALVVRGISDLLEGKARANANGSREQAAKNAVLLSHFILEQLHKQGDTSESEVTEEIIQSQDDQEALLAKAAPTQQEITPHFPMITELLPPPEPSEHVEVIPPSEYTGHVDDIADEIIRVLRRQPDPIDRLTLNSLVAQELVIASSKALNDAISNAVSILTRRKHLRVHRLGTVDTFKVV